MARNLIPSDATIKAIMQGDPRKRLSDGDGLLLPLFVNGGSHGWRFDYRIDSFEATAREWVAVKRGGWAPSYADKIIGRLEADVFPWIGQAPVAGITPPQLLGVLRRIESRGVVETAHRALENCRQVFRHAVATGKHSTNPARDLKDALKRPAPATSPPSPIPSVSSMISRLTHPRCGPTRRARCSAWPTTHASSAWTTDMAGHAL